MNLTLMTKSVLGKLKELSEFESATYPKKVINATNLLADASRPSLGEKRFVQLGDILSTYGEEPCPKVDSEVFEFYTDIASFLENDQELIQLVGKVLLERLRVYKNARREILINRNNN